MVLFVVVVVVVVVVVEGCLFQPPHCLLVVTNFPLIKCNGVFM